MLLPVIYIVMLLCYRVLHQYYTAAKHRVYSQAHAVYFKRDFKLFNRRHAVGLLASVMAFAQVRTGLLLQLWLTMPYTVILISKNKNCLQTYGF